VAYGIVATVGVIPVGGLAYSGRPPGRLSDLAAALFVMLVFAMSFFHWRLWVPAFGMGLDFRLYARYTLRSLAYSLGLALAGGLILFLLGRTISGR